MRKIQKCGKQSLYNGDFFLSYLKEKYFKVLRIFVVNFKCFFFITEDVSHQLTCCDVKVITYKIYLKRKTRIFHYSFCAIDFITYYLSLLPSSSFGIPVLHLDLIVCCLYTTK